MAHDNHPQKDSRQVLTMEEIEFINGDLQQKYEDLLNSPSLDESDKSKWKAAFDEFSDFYNNAPCGYHTIDDTGLIINMNQTELNWLGYKRNEVVNKKNIMDILSDKSGMLYYSEMPRLRDKGHVDQLEVEYMRKDKTILHALVSARAIYDENGIFKCGRSTLWDITDRKKMEDEMYKVNRHLRAIKERFTEKNTLVQKLNEELQLVKKMQDDFYSSLNINLTQPLSKIANLCYKALNTTTPGIDSRSLKDIQDIVKEVSTFVGNTRLQRRLSSDNTILQVTALNLSTLLVTVVNRLEEQAGKKKININCEIFEELWIESDKEILGQVIDTLLATVIKLSLPGKEIPLRLIHKVNECLVELEINGLSISSKEFAEMFDKDAQVSADAGKGADMVLNSHLINSLLADLGFVLTVNPVNHKGTLIRISIPMGYGGTATMG